MFDKFSDCGYKPQSKCAQYSSGYDELNDNENLHGHIGKTS